MSDALKPCPFCGESANKPDHGAIKMDRRRWWIFCSNPNCITRPLSLFETEALAITAWNTRADTRPSEVELSKALAELLDAFECEPDDLMPHEYEAIVADAKKRARALLSPSP